MTWAVESKQEFTENQSFKLAGFQYLRKLFGADNRNLTCIDQILI